MYLFPEVLVGMMRPQPRQRDHALRYISASFAIALLHTNFFQTIKSSKGGFNFWTEEDKTD